MDAIKNVGIIFFYKEKRRGKIFRITINDVLMINAELPYPWWNPVQEVTLLVKIYPPQRSQSSQREVYVLIRRRSSSVSSVVSVVNNL